LPNIILDELFRVTYEHEQLITQKINELAHAAMTSQDYPTFNFLQWYVAEQHEEEKLFKSVIDKLTLVVKAAKACTLLIKSWRRSTRRINFPRRSPCRGRCMRQILLSAVLNPSSLAINLPFSLKTPPAPPRLDFLLNRCETAPLRQSGGDGRLQRGDRPGFARGEHHLQHFMTMNRRHNPSCKTARIGQTAASAACASAGFIPLLCKHFITPLVTLI
jgi:hypothetical protein